MFYIIQHQLIVFLFFTFPLFGWILYKSFNDKVIWIGLSISILFLLPCIIGYSYVIDILEPLFFYIALSCGHCFIIEKYKNIYTTIVKPTITSFFVFGIVSFMAGFYGSITVQDVWKVKDYKIEYLRDQGFSGGALMTYRLYEYADIPIFIKHVDTQVDINKTGDCIIKFEYKNFSFDSCSYIDRVF